VRSGDSILASNVAALNSANGFSYGFDGVSSWIESLRNGKLFGEATIHRFDVLRATSFVEKVLKLAQAKFACLVKDDDEATTIRVNKFVESCACASHELSSFLTAELAQDRTLFCRILTSLLDAGFLTLVRVLLTPVGERIEDEINGGALELLQPFLGFASQGLVLTRNHLRGSGGLLNLLLWFVSKFTGSRTKHIPGGDVNVALKFIRCCSRFGVPLPRISHPVGLPLNDVHVKPEYNDRSTQRTSGSRNAECEEGGSAKPESYSKKNKKRYRSNQEPSKPKVPKKSKTNFSVKSRSEKKTLRAPPPLPPQSRTQPVLQRAPGKRQIRPVATTNISHEHLGLRCYHGAL